MRQGLASVRHIFYLLFCFQILGSSISHAEEKITLATIGNFPPYAYYKHGMLAGIDIDVLDELSKRANIKFDYKTFPWKRALKKTEMGQVDGMFSLFRNEEREVYAYFVEPAIHYSTYKLFVRKGDEFPYRSIRDLYGKNIVINLGYFINAELENAITNGKVKALRIPYTGEALSVLTNRKVDVLIGNYHEILHNKRNNADLKDIIDLPRPIQMPKEAYLAISKKSKITDKDALIAKLSHHLLTIHQDGTMNKIIQKHHPALFTQDGAN